MTSSTILLAAAILSSSFFGSWHCGAMCGPIVTLMKTRKALAPYHLGRAISYISLGAAAGAVGEFFLTSDFQIVRAIAALVLAGSLAAMGLKLAFPKSRFARYRAGAGFSSSRAHQRVMKLTRDVGILNGGFVLGMLSALLPCGWLYTYVIAAAATKSALAGSLTLTLFWLGGLPILLAVPTMLKSGIAAAGLKQQKIAGAILVLSSGYSLAMFYLHL